MTTPTMSPTAYRDTTDEESLQRTITDVADVLGYLVWHETDSRRSNAGMVDLVIAGHGLCLMAELKTAKGKVRAEQLVWLRELQAATVHETWLVRPADLDGVLELLRRMAEGDTT